MLIQIEFRLREQALSHTHGDCNRDGAYTNRNGDSLTNGDHHSYSDNYSYTIPHCQAQRDTQTTSFTRAAANPALEKAISC